MKSAIIFLKILQVAAGICALLLLLNNFRKEALAPGKMEEFPLKPSYHEVSYNIEVRLPDQYNLAEKYATILLLSSHLPLLEIHQ